MTDLLTALGLVLVLEGLLYAAAPGAAARMARAMELMGEGRLRRIGLIAMAAGVGLIWMIRA